MKVSFAIYITGWSLLWVLLALFMQFASILIKPPTQCAKDNWLLYLVWYWQATLAVMLLSQCKQWMTLLYVRVMSNYVSNFHFNDWNARYLMYYYPNVLPSYTCLQPLKIISLFLRRLPSDHSLQWYCVSQSPSLMMPHLNLVRGSLPCLVVSHPVSKLETVFQWSSTMMTVSGYHLRVCSLLWVMSEGG